MKNRIPFEYFKTKGKGSSDLEIHAGSYHMALFDAGISDYNIQVYSSVLPAISKEVEKERVKEIQFGSELYTIMSCIHGKKGEYISCGIIHGDLINNDGEKIGGLVCEISGNYEENEELPKRLLATLQELHSRTYKQYKLANINYSTNSFVPDRVFGTCLVSICFISYN